MEHSLDREKAVAEVGLGGGTDADARARSRDQIELVAVGVRRMDDRRARSETAARVEQLDRPQTVLGKALLDLARLLVRVDVQRQPVLRGVAAQLLEPRARAGADGVGGNPDPDPVSAQLLDLIDVRGHRVLPEALQAAARVGDVKEGELDSRLGRSLGRSMRLREPEVVELADGGVPGRAQLAIDRRITRSHPFRGLTPRELEHRLAPRPEIGAFGPPAQRPLERVAVRVDEARDPRRLLHARILPHMEAPAPAVSAPLAQLPNALTVARLALIPIFVVLMVQAGHNPSWPAGIVFGIAGVTDQIDGFLARRWHVESRFGQLADPLADRLMIDAAVILLAYYDRLPWIGLAVIVGRDVLLLAGSRLLAPRGVEIEVNTVGKAATWVLYAAIGFRIVTHEATKWPLYLFWAGLALALVAAVFYIRTARRELRR